MAVSDRVQIITEDIPRFHFVIDSSTVSVLVFITPIGHDITLGIPIACSTTFAVMGSTLHMSISNARYSCTIDASVINIPLHSLDVTVDMGCCLQKLRIP